MEWTGQEAFVGQPLKEWLVDAHVAGVTRSAKGLTFATIYGAGHMVSIAVQRMIPFTDCYAPGTYGQA